MVAAPCASAHAPLPCDRPATSCVAGLRATVRTLTCSHASPPRSSPASICLSSLSSRLPTPLAASATTRGSTAQTGPRMASARAKTRCAALTRDPVLRLRATFCVLAPLASLDDCLPASPRTLWRALACLWPRACQHALPTARPPRATSGAWTLASRAPPLLLPQPLNFCGPAGYPGCARARAFTT